MKTNISKSNFESKIKYYLISGLVFIKEYKYRFFEDTGNIEQVNENTKEIKVFSYSNGIDFLFENRKSILL